MTAVPGRRTGAVQPRNVVQIDPGEFVDTVGQFVVCQTCGVPLNKFTSRDDDSVQWLHTRNWQQYDHEPIPVVTDCDEVQATCDFCGTVGRLFWAYTGDRITRPSPDVVITKDYGTVWGACENCDPLIVAGDLGALLTRVKRVAPSAKRLSKQELEQRGFGWRSLWEEFLSTVHSRDYVGPRRQPTKLTPRMMPKLRNGLLKFWGEPSERIREQWVERSGQRAALPIPGVHAGDEDVFIVRFTEGELVPEQVWKNHTSHLRAGIGVAEMYWVSEQFTTLAIAAGKDFTDNPVLDLDALPAKFGFMMFESPIGELQRTHGVADLRGVSWTIVPNGVWFNLYIQGEDGDPSVEVLRMREEMGYLVCPNTGGGFVFGQPVPLNEHTQFQFMSTIMATFFLMRQPGVTEQTVAPVDRKYARAYRRLRHREPDPVRLVGLRHTTRSRSGGTHVGRPMEYRQYRKGHWKRVPYGPGRSLRDYRFISPYVTGTEDMPFRAPQEKVTMVR